MKRLLLNTEFKNLLREKVAVIIAAFSIILAGLAFLNGHFFSQSQSEVVEAAWTSQQHNITEAATQLPLRLSTTEPVKWWQDRYDLRAQAFYVMVNYATKPPLPASPIAIGQADVLPYYFRMLVQEKQQVVQQYDYVHPLNLLLGQFDLSFVLIYLLPLLTIGICFNALSNEQHSGQLRLLLLQGGSAGQLLTIQILSRGAIVLLPFLVISNLFFMLFREQIELQTLTKFTLITLLYGGFWLALCAWVNSRGKSAATNAAILVTCWLSFVVVLPALINTFITHADPTPSRIQYIDSLRASTDEAKKAAEKTLAQFFQDHPELASSSVSGSDFATKKIATINAVEQAMQAFDEQYQQIQQAQLGKAMWLKYLSVATLTHSILVELSGNGLVRHNAFMAQVQRHHQALQSFFAAGIVEANQQGDFSPCKGCNARPTITDLSTLPQFDKDFPTPNVNLAPMLWLIVLSLLLIYRTSRNVGVLAAPQTSKVVV
ncbi:DUF3526 domain-containing protein [Pseudoalteromonas luteoviolacea]|uniref:DUF3526 domain-containing protein n=1 Tax=Pseudoalteromonas luteoviolacea S4060-1 TaxID=1365257 RepID=A0A167NX83_9GAMM|nr:DUF3526 domain-containing protein [Pseudoalteromonas luteoviolacea]KZN69034.1 hypothetical protein N478_12690 [Pseudoalteromonas luteoviolacea S4060-1]